MTALMACNGKIAVGVQTWFRFKKPFNAFCEKVVVVGGFTRCCRLIRHGIFKYERHSLISRVIPGLSGHIKQNQIGSPRLQSSLFFHTSSSMHDNSDNLDSWMRKVTVCQSSKNDNEKVLTFEMSVLDTFPDDTEQKRCTVVAIHGFPGTCGDFQSLAVKLHDKGIRLVAASALGQADNPIDLKLLPEIDFSTKGRARNLQLLMLAMNIHRIDMLLSHSAGAWTMYEAGAHWTNVSSLFGINPAGAEPNRPIRPVWVIRLLAYMLQRPWFRRIFVPVLVFSYRKLGFKDVSMDGSGNHLIVTQQFLAQIQFEQVSQNALLIQLKQIPLLFAYSLNDKILEPCICAQMAYNHLGIPIENTVFVKEETTSKNPFFVPEGWLARCLVFSRGGHILHLAEEDAIVNQIVDMLKLVAGSRADAIVDESVPSSYND